MRNIKLMKLLAAAPLALALTLLPVSNVAIAFEKPVMAVLQEPDPEVIPSVECATLSMPDIEAEYASGVAGCMAGNIGNVLVVIGGTNLTDNKITFEAERQIFGDIYVAKLSNSKLQWTKAGVLPNPAAYGVCLKYGDSLIVAGGTGAEADLRQVVKVDLVNGEAVLENLPDLPGTMSHMSGCVIGSKLYLAGGVLDEKPSNAVLCLDMENTEAGWQMATYFPGSARIDGVCAAADGKLCIWGGYTESRSTNPYILSKDGYTYDPVADIWTAAATPRLVNGYRSKPVYVGSGTAVNFGADKVIVTGGVDDKLFVDVKKTMPEDYLQHEIEWYKYNPFVMVYSVATNSWSIMGQTSQTARTDSTSIVVGNKMYIIGGEIMPGVCTDKITVIQLSE